MNKPLIRVTCPDLLRLSRSCAKWRGGRLLVATLLAGVAWLPMSRSLDVLGGVKPKPSPSAFAPGTVTDLAVNSVTDRSVTVIWTAVTSGTVLPAKYAVRYGTSAGFSWGTASETAPVPGASPAAGERIQLAITGLLPATAYSVQLVAFTGTLNVDAVFGGLSNVVSGTTLATPPPPPPPPPSGPADTLWASWTWRNGNYVKVTSTGTPSANFCDPAMNPNREVRFDLKSGLRTTTLTMTACEGYGWTPVAFALASIADSGQVGPLWGPDGYRLQVTCRPKTTGCTLTLKRPLLWGTTITFTLGPLPTSEFASLRAALARASGVSPRSAPTFPYSWRQP